MLAVKLKQENKPFSTPVDEDLSKPLSANINDPIYPIVSKNSHWRIKKTDLNTYCTPDEVHLVKNEAQSTIEHNGYFDLAKDTSETHSRRSGRPPMEIETSSTSVRSRGRTTCDIGGEMVLPSSAQPQHPTKRSVRKKKRLQKSDLMAAMNTVRGFTPVTSGDEGSNFSNESIPIENSLTSKRNSSIISSSSLRSSSPSALTQQLEALSIETLSERISTPKYQSKLACETAGNASIPSETSSVKDIADVTSYEVPLNQDYINPDVALDESNGIGTDLVSNPMFRKMTAKDFEPLRCLGKGTYGTVLLVKQTSTGKLFAQKQFKKASLVVRKELIDQTKTERAILESINRHPFVVKLYYAFQDHEKLYLILEYAQGGELFTRMQTEQMFPEDTAAFYMAEMVLALEHLHHNVGVLYRDLKPENILLDAEGHLLLTDFGLSKVAVDGEHQCRSMTGTLEYMAPEVVLQENYGTAVDWWSFGILGFDLLTGSSPFHANNETKIRHKIVKQKLVLPFFLSPDAKDLLTRLLRKDPKKRLGGSMPKDMEIIKNHRFFRKIDWKKLESRELEPPIKPLITDPALAENFSTEFTNLAMSPVNETGKHEWFNDSMNTGSDPFGGFSFVASRSFFEERNGLSDESFLR